LYVFEALYVLEATGTFLINEGVLAASKLLNLSCIWEV
jgi:hypothetical protein